MQTLRIVLTLPYLRALHDALRETFLKVTNNEMQTAKWHWNQLEVRTDFKYLSLVLDRELWVGKKKEGGGGVWKKCTKFCLQPVLHKLLATKQAEKKNISKQYSKQAKTGSWKELQNVC